MVDQIQWIFFSVPSLLIAATIHEYAHAYSAYLLGDRTAKANGRMTLNPLAHIDPIGALMMIFARFGWSKPVPVNEYNFKDPVKGTAITSFAGPASNLLLAALSAIPLRFMISMDAFSGDSFNAGFFATLLLTFVMVNISLAVFNMLPFPPLDGHKIVRAFLPANLRSFWENLQNYSLWILLLLFLPFSPLSYIVLNVLSFLTGSLLVLLLG